MEDPVTWPDPVTWLYVPAVDTAAMRRALVSGADAVVYDLEDTVRPERRDQARILLRGFLDELAEASGSFPRILVRINAVSDPRGVDDIEALAGSPVLDGVRVPKVTSAADLDEVAAAFGASCPALFPLLESAGAIERVTEIVGHRGVHGVVIGEQDLRVELGVRDESAFAWIRSRVLVAARAAGLPAPPLNVYTGIHDDAALRASCLEGRRLGLFGRSALDERQIPVIRAAFTPDDEEVEAARAVVAAGERAAGEGRGASLLDDGTFVDEPIVEAARRTLALYERLTGTGSGERGRELERR